MRISFYYIVIILFFSGCQSVSENIPISISNSWKFSMIGDSTNWYKASVPGIVHLDLLSSGIIEDPYWENNEIKQKWIETKDWTYKTNISISKDQLNNKNIELDCEGLDTYAEVYVNDSLLMVADNMFRSWQVDIKEHLYEGNNKLEIKFYSPININSDKVRNHPFKLPSGCESDTLNVGNFTRKAAYHFGWDWGPRFVTAGIWKPIKINTWHTARIKKVNCQTVSISDTLALLKVEVLVEKEVGSTRTIQLKVNDDYQLFELNDKLNKLSFDLSIENPKLWWCQGYGEPNLYDLNVELYSKTALLDSNHKKIGIRTIELINEPDSIGTSFYFKLNNQPIFIKGANYIPQDLFLPRVTDNQYVNLISQVKSANMNMLRVWGGGIYEKDIFYDLCDENGLLVWQDFMFAGSLYPSDSLFNQNIKAEVKENVERLRIHPCIALWCGNNEIEVAWKNWGWQNQYGYSASDSIEIWDNYRFVFHEMIPELLVELHPEINYTSTSPLSNWGTAEYFNHSSMHYWGVWHGKDHFDEFKKNVGRFMVEYGFQSFPELATILKFANDSSLYLNAEVMLNRQKSYIGNGLISEHISHYYQAPNSFIDFVQLSQLVQAKGLKIAIDAHINNQPHCMGTMFWQLNDCWPGPSWSVIDYYGNEKIAYDSVKTAFE